MPLRIVRAQCLFGAMLCAVLLPAGTQVFWSAVCGAAACVAPSTVVSWWLWRAETASGSGAGKLVARSHLASVLKLFGAGLLLGLALSVSAWSPSDLAPKVIVSVFMLCALGTPLIAAAVAARN